MRMLDIYYRLFSPYFFGFTQGHQDLTSEQVLAVERALGQGIDGQNMVREYEKKFVSFIGNGQGISFAAGRMAFYVFLKVLGVGMNDEVILPAFTCSVMPNAVLRSGAKPVFSDIDLNTLGSSPVEIEKCITPRTKVIVAQHSFGIPCAIEEIAGIAKRHGIFLVEDVAISFGSTRGSRALGDYGDAAIFSTDHTKPLNTILGGILYTKDAELHKKVMTLVSDMPELSQDHQRRIYRQLLFERKYYVPERYGKSVLYDLFKQVWNKIQSVENPFLIADYGHDIPKVQSYPYPARMPAFLTQVGLFEMDRWAQEKARRQALLTKYMDVLSQLRLSDLIPLAYKDEKNAIVPLRFVFLTDLAGKLKEQMRRFLDVGQIWFQRPVICCTEGEEGLGYIPGSCINAEKASGMIINWPCVVPERLQDNLVGLFKRTCEIFKKGV